MVIKLGMASQLDFFVAKVLLKSQLVSKSQITESISHLERSPKPMKLSEAAIELGFISAEKAKWAEQRAQLDQFRYAESMYARGAEARGVPPLTIADLFERQKAARYQITLGQLLRQENLVSPEIDQLIRSEVMTQLRTAPLTLEKVFAEFPDQAPLSNLGLSIERQNIEAPGFKRGEKIADSPNSAVYRGQRMIDDKPVAIKFLPASVMTIPELRQEWERLAPLAERISHPNVVSVYAIGRAGPFPYIVTELVEGETIRQQIAKYGVFDSLEAQRIAAQVAEALEYADQFDLIHGNIKPDNIIVNRSGVAKLLDFSAVKIFPRHVLQDPALSYGVVNYMSPEAIEGQPCDRRSDLYSMGATLFHMLTGQVPFGDGRPEEILRRIADQNQDIPDVLTLRPDVDPKMAEVVERVTAKSPDFRMQDATEFRERLVGQGQTIIVDPSGGGGFGHEPKVIGIPATPPPAEGPKTRGEFGAGTRGEMMAGTRADIEVAEDPDDPLIGKVLFGRYKFLKKLGEGGMGKVYKVQHTMLKLIRALKLIQPHLVGSEENIRRFKREIDLHSRFQHRNVVQIYDAGSNEHYIYMAMECVNGEELSDILKREGRIEANKAVTVIRQVLDALEAAHAHKIIHRDLKTDNIMIAKEKSGEEIVKILDFGIARAMEGNSNITITGISGTPQYMSPEQCQGDQTDERSDLYSLGIILFELLAGELPFKAPNAVGYLGLHILQAPPTFKELNPELEVHPELERVVRKLLEKEKPNRYQSAREVLDDLEKNVIPAMNSRSTGGGGGFWAWLKRLFGKKS